MTALRFLITGLALCLLLQVSPARAQDDKGFLTNALQDALSDAGRNVSIDGFRGALSSEASFDRLTIADDEGVWLTLEGVVLVWNRSALLAGRLEVERLSARSLDLPRLPTSNASDLPSAEATGFSIPSLPISVDIAAFEVSRINLGAPVIGEPVTLQVTADAALNNTEADVNFRAVRTDGQRGQFIVDAKFTRADEALQITLNLDEAEDGIAARLLDLPGKPAVVLAVEGDGPLDDFAADVSLASDGQDRVTGKITLAAQRNSNARRLQTDLHGDVTPLIAPQYREFFGTDISLTLDALREEDGTIDLSQFAIETAAASLSGKALIAPDGWPRAVDIAGKLSGEGSTPVLLPIAGAQTYVSDVVLDVRYDQRTGDQLLAQFDLSRLTSPDFVIEQTSLVLNGQLQGGASRDHSFDGAVHFDATGLQFTDAGMAAAVGETLTGRADITFVDGDPLAIRNLALSGADYGLTGTLSIDGPETEGLVPLALTLKADNLARFAALTGQALRGKADLSLNGSVRLLAGGFDLGIEGTASDLKIGIEQADALLLGKTKLRTRAVRDGTGTYLQNLSLSNAAVAVKGSADLKTDASRIAATALLSDIGLIVPQYEGRVSLDATAEQDAAGWRIAADAKGPYAATARIEGRPTGEKANLVFKVFAPRSEAFVPQISGPVHADGALRQTPEGWQISTRTTGPFNADADVKGIIAGGPIDLRFDATLPDARAIAPQIGGTIRAQGTLQQTGAVFRTESRIAGPYDARTTVAGVVAGAPFDIAYTLSMPNVRPLVAGVSGPLEAQGNARQTERGIAVSTIASGPYQSRARIDGIATGPEANLTFDVSLPNVGAIAPNITGPLAAKGTARQRGDGWQLETDVDGPSGTQAQVAGLVRTNGQLDLGITGSAPLGLSAPFIAPRRLNGTAQFDLALNGPPTLSSLSGTVRTDNAQFSAPNLRFAIETLAANIRLAQGRANVEATARASSGGEVAARGTVSLEGRQDADLQILLQELVLIDPRLYRTNLNGSLTLQGPLSGGARIGGQINVAETRVSVPGTGLTSIGTVPDIRHIGDTRPVAATRRKAGLNANGNGTQTGDGSGPGFPLNVTVNAPNRIFVRGRGLDAELGGALTLTGNTNRVISAGRFDLLRGRLDILGKRFDLREGSIQFLGDLVPYVRFVSATSTAAGEVRVIVEGPVDAPEVTFESSPEAPQDEVLAQLLFGRDIDQISAFQALQLANAVAVLAGRGGNGVIGNLREGFGLDDLDVTTNDDGAVAVRAGKYISDNVYSDVTASSDGTADVSLNIDLTPNLTLRGSLGSDGNTGIGIFFEKDY